MPPPVQPTNPPAVHGKQGVLMVSTSKVSTPAPVALITEWAIDRTSDKVETTALGDANKTYVKGLDDVKGTFSGQWDSTDDTLFEAAESVDGVQIEIYPDVNNAFCLKGPAWLDVSIKGGVSVAVTIDGNFSANGSWLRVASGVPPAMREPGTPGALPPGMLPGGIGGPSVGGQAGARA